MLNGSATHSLPYLGGPATSSGCATLTARPCLACRASPQGLLAQSPSWLFLYIGYQGHPLFEREFSALGPLPLTAQPGPWLTGRCGIGGRLARVKAPSGGAACGEDAGLSLRTGFCLLPGTPCSSRAVFHTGSMLRNTSLKCKESVVQGWGPRDRHHSGHQPPRGWGCPGHSYLRSSAPWRVRTLLTVPTTQTSCLWC